MHSVPPTQIRSRRGSRVGFKVSPLVRWEFLEAREQFERARARFQPGRDDDLTYRFGMDPAVTAMAYLAFVLWSLGAISPALRAASTSNVSPVPGYRGIERVDSVAEDGEESI